MLTTATVLETGKGNFDVAIALSAILLMITFLVNWAHLDPATRPGLILSPVWLCGMWLVPQWARMQPSRLLAI